jgi:hypothetical protein
MQDFLTDVLAFDASHVILYMNRAMVFAFCSPWCSMAKRKKMAENTERFRELILYVSQKCANDPRFGATKLNKILYFSDVVCYAHYGKPLTGMEYQRLPNGPAPKKLIPIRAQMQASGELGLQPVHLKSGNVQIRTVNLRAANLDVFDAKEIALVDAVIEFLNDETAQSVSDLSHKMLGWKLARDKEIIPYSTVFLTNAPLDEIDIQRGREVAKEFGLVGAA